MNKTNAFCMQALSVEFLADLRLLLTSVHRITGYGMADVRHMHAYLMGATCF